MLYNVRVLELLWCGRSRELCQHLLLEWVKAGRFVSDTRASWFASSMFRGIVVRPNEAKVTRNFINGTRRSARTLNCSVGSEVGYSTWNYISYPLRILSNFYPFVQKVKWVYLRLNGWSGQLQSHGTTLRMVSVSSTVWRRMARRIKTVGFHNIHERLLAFFLRRKDKKTKGLHFTLVKDTKPRPSNILLGKTT